MMEFFRGWRRKAGLVTLVMACAFTSGWVRSLTVRDFIGRYTTPLTYNAIASERQLLAFEYHFSNRLPPGPDCPYTNCSTSPLDSQLLFKLDLNWYVRCCGFGFGEDTLNTANGRRFLIWIVPYWSIVIPLTLISAFLLISKPVMGPNSLKPRTSPK